jgi:lipopolysaccharide transport system permease protein
MTIQPHPAETKVLILRPSSGWSALNLADLWRYRELIYFLIWRDLKVRYKQTRAFLGDLAAFRNHGGLHHLLRRAAKIPSDVPTRSFVYRAAAWARRQCGPPGARWSPTGR